MSRGAGRALAGVAVHPAGRLGAKPEAARGSGEELPELL